MKERILTLSLRISVTRASVNLIELDPVIFESVSPICLNISLLLNLSSDLISARAYARVKPQNFQKFGRSSSSSVLKKSLRL